jgi:hypothetical protein
MEDASAVDLDWFWRGWFYTTDHVDISIADVKWFQVDSKNPTIENKKTREWDSKQPKFVGDQRNEGMDTYMKRDSSLVDFYTSYDPLKVTPLDLEEYVQYMEKLNDAEKALLDGQYQYYQIDLACIGGLVMPVILEFEFADGSAEIVRIPAEIWKLDQDKVSKLFYFEKEVVSVTLDPFLETADVDVSNNYWPRRILPNRFELYKQSGGGRHGNRESENPMQKQQKMDNKQGERLQQEEK